MDNLKNLTNEVIKKISLTKDLHSLDQLRIQYLGKKSKLTNVLKNLAKLPTEQRIKMGKAINTTKNQLTELIEERHKILTKQQLETEITQQFIDVTLPGRCQNLGSLHPVTKIRERLEKIFMSIGFIAVEGPEIEDDFHNFEALNIPQYHPARTTMDTFYLQNTKLLLRTHTSPVQIRALQKYGVPLRAIAIGRVFRRDSDITHTPMFHQLEGLMVDDHTNFTELKGLLNNVLENFFEREVKLRFRPSYFPFTEPSAEVDMYCIFCNGKGCRVCKESGWIELLGCGMVHPNVLNAVEIDSEKNTGFAFGIGLDRLAMFRYGINDLRLLFENDLKFLEQF
jgi:phenylalanyl-tRNA synthetase alpha chain